LINLALTPDPSPKLGRGERGELFPFSQAWEKGLGDEGWLIENLFFFFFLFPFSQAWEKGLGDEGWLIENLFFFFFLFPFSQAWEKGLGDEG
jgi:hypothetical protein